MVFTIARAMIRQGRFETAHGASNHPASIDQNRHCGDGALRSEPLPRGPKRDVHDPLVDLRNSRLKDTDHAHQLAGDLALCVLGRQHHSRAQPELQTLRQLGADVGGQSVVRLQVAPLDGPLIQSREAGLVDRIYAGDLHGTGAGG
jgi:hypothetical protein